MGETKNNINENSSSINENNNQPISNTYKDREHADIRGDVADNTKFISVLTQDILITSVDKIRLAFASHMNQVKIQGLWKAPLGIFLTLLLSFQTTTFNDFLGLSGDTWKGFFLLGCLASAIWTAKASIKAYNADSEGDVESFIKKITVAENSKDESAQIQQTKQASEQVAAPNH